MLKLAYLKLKNLQTLRENNSRIVRIKDAKFSGFCFYMNTNLWGDFKICIGVPLKNCLQNLPSPDPGFARRVGGQSHSQGLSVSG